MAPKSGTNPLLRLRKKNGTANQKARYADMNAVKLAIQGVVRVTMDGKPYSGDFVLLPTSKALSGASLGRYKPFGFVLYPHVWHIGVSLHCYCVLLAGKILVRYW